MKKFKQGLSLFMVFVFLVVFVPKFNFAAKAAVTQMPAADTAVTLVGDFISANNLGNNWDPANAQTLMKEYSNGVYEIAVNFTTAGNYNYKAALNRGWDNAIGNAVDNNNKTINVANSGTVVFRVDLKAKKVYDTINDPTLFKTSATLVGSFGVDGDTTYWNPTNASYDLAYIGGGFYKGTFHLAKGNYEYKIAYNHAWTNGEVGTNVTLNLDSEQDVTFLANPAIGICSDSVSNPSILGSISLIGTIRGLNSTGDSDPNWDPSLKGYEFSPLTGDGKYIYSGFFPAGTYEYKGIEDYSWNSGGIPSSGNKTIKIPDGGKYVVFVADRVNRTMFDSINNPDDVAAALGLKQPEVVVNSPVINPDGTVTFNYKNNSAASVKLMGTMNDWNGTPMVKDSKTGIWSYAYRPGDAAQNIEYKFLVDGNWITDPLNNQYAPNGNSLLVFPQYSGRRVVLAGTIQTAAGDTAWNPSSDLTKFNYDGNGLYSITIPNVPAGNYEYKVAMGSWDPENYGANGVSYGPNMSVTVTSTQDVTFWYSDDSHFTVNSIEYQKLDISLTGTGIPIGTKLIDPLLSNLYSTKITLDPGTYTDIKAILGDKEYNFGTIVLNNKKDVTFTYVPSVQMVYSDAADNKIAADQLYFDSRMTDYKSPYGAVPTGTEVTFNLKAKEDDLTIAKLVLSTANGIQMIDMQKNGSFGDGYDKWTATYKFNQIEMDKYYFIVSNGADLKAYGDDDGYFGPGTACDIGKVQRYDLNVYQDNYKTPDWMKNAVIYQIFPDRFFNGDTSNDYNQKLSRGFMPYEYPENWYAIPEDPTLEYITDADGNVIRDSNGSPTPIPDYKGNPGDGNWGNDMYGGDLKGIEDKLNYLQSLGVTVLYLNPVSESISNHRYDTTDYLNVDPLLGTIQDFENLTRKANERGMHVILDGVFNHVSDDSIYFDRYGKYMAKGRPIGAYQYWSKVYDLMNLKGLNQQDAEKRVQADLTAAGITDFHYKDWFKVDNVKVTDGIFGEHYAYEGWWGNDSMPVITNPGGSEYNVSSWADEIIDGNDANSRFWLKEGSDGWRLDVANEVSDETWRHFRDAVKAEGDNAIIGEIWDNASRYLLGDMYDSVMNYRFRDAVIGFVTGKDTSGNPTDAAAAINKLEQMREQYPKEAFEAMMNLVDSHDTQRIISAIDGYQKSVKDIAEAPSANALQLMKLVPLMQMTYPGAPTIYYGDEAGMYGADDPDCRRGMLWGDGNQDMVNWYALLANIRNAYPVLRTGDIRPLSATSEDIMAYARSNSTDSALIVINRGSAANDFSVDVQGTIADGTKLTDAVTGTEYTVSNGTVTVNVPEKLGLILVTSYDPNKVQVNYHGLRDAYDPSFKVADRTIPQEVADNIASLDRIKSTEGDAVVFTETQLITNDVLELARTLGKTVVLDRNEATFKISPDSILGILPNVNGKFNITCSTQLERQNKINEILKHPSSDLVKALRIDTTVIDGIFGAPVNVQVQLDKSLAGKALYVYYYDPHTKLQLITKGGTDDSGSLSFDITHGGDYFISSQQLNK